MIQDKAASSSNLDPVEGEDAEQELAQLAKAIAHPARVRILKVLEERNQCTCGELVELLPLAQSTVSQHLKVLRDAGLVHGASDGPRTSYRLEHGGLRRLRALVSAL